MEDERIAWPASPAWARVTGGMGSYTPENASVGAEFDFERFSAEAGLNVPLGEIVEASISVRGVRGSADVTSPVDGGDIKAEGVGIAFGASVIGTNAWYVKGRFSVTNYELDIESSTLGQLKAGVDALGRFMDLEAGRRIQLSETMKLTPRAWVTHSAFDVDAFTDSVDTRVSLDDMSRLTGGAGMAAETVRPAGNGELSLRGSLGVERVFRGAQTSVDVSGEMLSSRSAGTRLLLGLGGTYRQNRFSLTADFSATGLGSDDQQYSGRTTFGINF
ncbi:MAG: autotransporter outer membrane beta-barrel domain-containing protein [Gemmatimonadetes bacterium]|nr:autotransporter outer membrane beta-barrel domain-containing protein [Gemmatimonadota bacterium]MYB26154.1 autotransporter outer membrane beta-barrel domain-containing protein [Candidatus Dadabacteria bacterium]